MLDVCVIGHLTRDRIKTENAEKEMPGGTAHYFSMALKHLGASVSVLTKTAEHDGTLLTSLAENNIGIFWRASPETTYFENIYPEGTDLRIQRVRRVAQPFSTDDIPDVLPQIFHLGPLTREDVPLELLKLLARKARISMDVQGFLRQIDEGQVTSGDWPEKEEGLRYVSILKADESEAKILSGSNDAKDAALQLARYDIDEVIITSGSKGSLIYAGGRFHAISAFPPKRVVDATGCGDTYMAGYIYKRLQSRDIEESGRFAAATASLKLAAWGPFGGSEEDVQSFLESQVITNASRPHCK